MTDKLPKAELVANFIGRDVLALIIGELKQAKKPWHKLTESEQELVIRRAEQDVRGALRRGFLLIIGADFQKATATLEQVQFTGKGVAGKLALKGDAAERHKLADSVGQEVVVILTNAETYLARMGEIQAETDQRPLPLDAPPADDGPRSPPDELDDAGSDTVGDGAGIPTSEETSHEILHAAGISVDCVRDVAALVGYKLGLKMLGELTHAERAAVIDYCGAKHVAETSADYLTKGGTIPVLPYALGGSHQQGTAP